ncbi:dihydrofolate reductase family protein [Streptomyces sp. AD2-2]|nr:dihydrofolate reductase family protein [Streptomyces sp. AD2-2]
MTVTADLAISLDGYIAGTDVTIDNPGGDGEPLFEWIHDLASRREWQGMTGGEENRDSELMRECFDATGAVVMGRMMYDTGEEFWGDNPPFRTPVFVLGASALRQYLADGLIDELQLHVVPALLGAGLRLFDGPGRHPRRVEPLRVEETPLATHVKYRFAK